MLWFKAARVRTDMEREVRGDGENLIHMYVLVCVCTLCVYVPILACITRIEAVGCTMCIISGFGLSLHIVSSPYGVRIRGIRMFIHMLRVWTRRNGNVLLPSLQTAGRQQQTGE